MKKCALLTGKGLKTATFDYHVQPTSGSMNDDEFLIPALHNVGIEGCFVEWTANIDWDQYDCAVIRSTWDYISQLDRFFTVLSAIQNSSCKLLNPLSVIQWNSKKIYLQELATNGICVVPSKKLDRVDNTTLTELIRDFGATGAVIKPVIGSGAKSIFFLTDGRIENLETIRQLVSKEDFLIQPLIPSIQDGEISLCFFDKKFSHGVVKRPKKGEFRSQEEYGGETSSYHPTEFEIKFCQEILGHIKERLLYARVDFVRTSDSKPMLMELELIEPTLYFKTSATSVYNFATALLRLLRQS